MRKQILIDFVTALSMPDEDEGALRRMCNLTSENSFGNADDVFLDGMTRADAYTAIRARKTLREALQPLEGECSGDSTTKAVV